MSQATVEALRNGDLNAKLLNKPKWDTVTMSSVFKTLDTSSVTASSTTVVSKAQAPRQSLSLSTACSNTWNAAAASASKTYVKQKLKQIKENSPSHAWEEIKTNEMDTDEKKTPLPFEQVKRKVAHILGEELQLDGTTVLALSETFEFDEQKTLDEYGLTSLVCSDIYVCAL